MADPSVKPYQPDLYWSALNFPKRDYSPSQGEELYRRGVYIYWQRTFLHPSLAAFDASTREECTVNRVNSNTPLQALVLLNDPIFVEAERVFAQNALKKGGPTLNARISWAFLQAVGRTPQPKEEQILADLYQKSYADFRANPQRATSLLQVGRVAGGEGPAPRRSGRHDHGDARHRELHETIRRDGIEESKMDPKQAIARDINRRTFLGYGVSGLGMFALNGLMNPLLFGAETPKVYTSKGVVNPLHFPPRAKRVIFLYQAGGPSHLETFDPKPKLAELDGKPMPESFTKGQQIAQLQGKKLICFGPQYKFKRFGKAGLEMCELFPELGSVADDLCIVRSMTTEQINHDPAHAVMNSGIIIAGRPSMGSWVFYGLGSEAEDLPGFIVLISSGRGGQMQPIASRQWSSGFLPSKFQGVKFNAIGDPVLFIKNPPGIDTGLQNSSIQAIDALDKIEYGAVNDPEVLTRISQYEMAFKMQSSVPGLMDMSKEPQSILDMYGAKPGRWLVCVELPAGAAPGGTRRALHPTLPP